MKKKLVSLFLVLIMAFMPFMFAGCDIEIDENGEISGGSSGGSSSGGESSGWLDDYVSGFKVVYSRDMATGRTGKKKEIDSTFYDDLLNHLTGIYGNAKYKSITLNEYFPDSIRQTIVEKDGKLQISKNSGWNWTLDPNDSNIPVNNIKIVIDNLNDNFTNELHFSNIISYSSLTTGWRNYPQLANYYSTPIQIVMFETLLGVENLTTFEAKTTNGEFGVFVKECKSNSSLNGKNVTLDAVKNYLGDYDEENKTGTGLKLKYYVGATYSGFTKSDADKFIKYLLDEVVGKEAIKYDYENHKGTTNYRNYVETIARMVYEKVYDGESSFVFTYELNSVTKIVYDFDKDETANKSNQENVENHVNSFKPTPASYMSDFETDAFFGNNNYLTNMFEGTEGEATSFENSPLAEYQSVIMMYKQDYTFGGMWMQIFSQNPDLDINISLRFYAYNPTTKTGKLYTIKQEGINFYHDDPIKYDGEPESEYVEGKGYLYKTTDKDNDGNKIEGYYTDFMIEVDLTDIPEEFVQLPANDQDIEYYKVGEFKNEGELAPTEETPYGRKQKELDGNNKYKVIASENGFGGVIVLDEKKVDFSFCEIVFDTKKDLSKNEDYNCKLAIILPL